MISGPRATLLSRSFRVWRRELSDGRRVFSGRQGADRYVRYLPCGLDQLDNRLIQIPASGRYPVEATDVFLIREGCQSSDGRAADGEDSPTPIQWWSLLILVIARTLRHSIRPLNFCTCLTSMLLRGVSIISRPAAIIFRIFVSVGDRKISGRVMLSV